MTKKAAHVSLLLVMCPPFWTKLPPLGLACLATYLSSHKITVDVLDLNIALFQHYKQDIAMRDAWISSHDEYFCESLYQRVCVEHSRYIEVLIADICKENYTAIGFSVFKSNRRFCLSFAKAIKTRCRKNVIIFGGPEMMTYDTSLFWMNEHNKEIVDIVVRGEGEYSLYTIMQQLQNNVLEQSFYDMNDVRDLNVLPYPRYDIFHEGLYDRKRALPIYASRGCVRTCRFCAERLLSGSYRTRSAEHIFSELQFQTRERQIVWFTFHDSLLNGDLKVLRNVCNKIIENNLHIKWEAQIAIRNDMENELFELMKKAGCFNVFVGLESGSDTMLEKMNKGYTAKQAVAFFEKCMDAELHCEVSLIIGYPGETEVDFSETLTFLKNNKHLIQKIAQVNPFVPLQGTYAAQLVDAKPMKYDDSARKIKKLIDFFKKENIVYTEAFVNNLSRSN